MRHYVFTDDELLKFAVDDCPSVAVQDYVRRNLIDPKVADYEAIHRNMREAARKAGLLP